VNTAGQTVENKPNPRFKHYKELFNNLVKDVDIPTLYPICSVIITYNSKYAVTVTKRDEKEYYVKMYSLSTYDLEYEEKIGGNENDYIKLKEVEQNAKGDKFAIVYFNDGYFKLRTFVKKYVEPAKDQAAIRDDDGKSIDIQKEKVDKCEKRSEAEIQKNELNINDLLGLNNWTMAISGFPDPYITCCFIDDDRLFINLFYNYDLTHYHFIYDLKNNKIIGKIEKKVLDCSKKNFPYKCFYNDEKREVYSFYRQGHAFKIMLKEDDPETWTYQFEKMTDMDLG
jgi:hypothetical protein